MSKRLIMFFLVFSANLFSAIAPLSQKERDKKWELIRGERNYSVAAATIRSLVQQDINPNKPLYYSDESLLHLMAFEDAASEAVEALLQCGANKDEPGLDGVTPLHNAALYAAVQNVRILLAAGANVHALSDDYPYYTPLSLLLAHWKTSRDVSLDCKLETVQMLLDSGVSLDSAGYLYQAENLKLTECTELFRKNITKSIYTYLKNNQGGSLPDASLQELALAATSNEYEKLRRAGVRAELEKLVQKVCK